MPGGTPGRIGIVERNRTPLAQTTEIRVTAEAFLKTFASGITIGEHPQTGVRLGDAGPGLQDADPVTTDFLGHRKFRPGLKPARAARHGE